jgi:hypothetical protein
MEINHFLSITILVLPPIIILTLLWRGLRNARKADKDGIKKRRWPYLFGFTFAVPYAVLSFFLYALLWRGVLQYAECQIPKMIRPGNYTIATETPTYSKPVFYKIFADGYEPNFTRPICPEYIPPAYRPPKDTKIECVILSEASQIESRKKKYGQCIHVPLEEYDEWVSIPEVKERLRKRTEELKQKTQ